MTVELQVQQFIDFIRDEMPRRIKTNPNSLPDAQKLLVSVSGTLEVIYKTLAELDIAIKSDVDTELSNKEPTITAGTSEQYFRGDKTWQTLDTDAVPETTSRVYLSPAQKTVATQAASSTVNGYLSSADWSTFNSKQAALVSGTNIKTVNSSSLLGSGDLVVGEQSVVLLEQDGSQTLSVGKRHYLPYITTAYTLNLNAPTGAAIGDWFILESRYSASLDGIGLSAFLLGINLKMAAGEYVIGYGDIVSPDTIPLLDVHNNSTNSPNFTSGCSFRFTKVTATGWALQPTYGSVMPERFHMKVSGTNFGGTTFISTAAAGSYATVTLPPKNVDLGDLTSVATNDGNTLSGTRTRILGGSNNTVSGTDNVAIGCNYVKMTGSSNTAMSCAGSATPAQATEFAGTGNTFTSCSGYILGTGCTLVSYSGFTYYANLRAAYNALVVPRHSSVVFNTFSELSITSGVYGNSNASSGVLVDADGIKPVMWIDKSFGIEVSEHIVKIKADTGSFIFYGERKVLYKVGDGGTPLVTTIGTDIGTGGMELTVSIVITATGTGNKDMSITVQNGAALTSWSAKIESTHF